MSVENRTVEIKGLKDLPRVPLGSVVGLQGKLKSLSAVNYDRLKQSMLKRDFFVPLFVWVDKSESPVVHLRLMDGHQRVLTLRKMKDEGFTVPAELPAVMIDAADEIEARDKLLAIVSQFGEIDKEGLYEFLTAAQLDPNSVLTDFHMPEIDAPKFLDEFFTEKQFDPGTESDQGKLDQKALRHFECPHCSKQFELSEAREIEV